MTDPEVASGDAPAGINAGEAAYKRPAYRNFVLGMLTLAYIFSFVDRQIVNILGPLIIEDLGLSDAQFGALSGIAFAAIYVTVGIPVARLADMGVRSNIIAVSLTVWSLMTAACGFAQNFWQLMLARAGVGVGEAGCSPPAHSMISDMFPANKRSTAMSIYSLGVYTGSLIGYVGGAYVAANYGWRMAFVVVGLPGVVLAVLIKLLVKEPPRGMAEGRVDNGAPSFTSVFSLLWSRSSFKHLSFACALHAFATYGLGSFMPAFLSRVHGMPITDIGIWLGLVAGVGGLLGTLTGGLLADKLANRTGDMRWHLWVPLYSTIVAMPFFLVTFLYMDTGMGAIFSWSIPVFVGGMYLGPCISMTHSLVGMRMRALASAILFLVLNLIGLGLGPWITGIISDLLRPEYGIESIRYALAGMVFVNAWCAIHYYNAARSLRKDLARAPE